jgi:hypothetical protein
MNPCPACGEPYRKGRRALLLLPTGELEPRIVCQDCARKVAVRIVPRSASTSTCHACRSSAKWCDDHRMQAPALRTLKERLTTHAKVANMMHGEREAGRFDGLTMAIDLVNLLLEGRPL